MPTRWEENLKASEWIVRSVIGKYDIINFLQLDMAIGKILRKVVAFQKKGGRHFYFILGTSLTLREWLETEIEVGNLLACGTDTGSRYYQLSPFMYRLLEKENAFIHKLLHKTTGLEQLLI